MTDTGTNPAADKVVVITGVTGGLGRALALAFAEARYEVIGLYRTNSASASDLAASFEAKGHRGNFIQQDITGDAGWTAFENKLKQLSGKHITLIANATVPFTPKPFHLTDWDEFREQFEIGVKGTAETFRRLLPLMVSARQGALISVLSSVLESRPKGFSAYLTAKSAMAGFLAAATAEYYSRGLKFFSVSPGFMRTGLTDAWSDHLKNQISSGGVDTLSPVDVARAILALAEAESTKGIGEDYPMTDPLSFFPHILSTYQTF